MPPTSILHPGASSVQNHLPIERLQINNNLLNENNYTICFDEIRNQVSDLRLRQHSRKKMNHLWGCCWPLHHFHYVGIRINGASPPNGAKAIRKEYKNISTQIFWNP